jgi:metal-responsive CopG/Arc/MetJ family transcriptional regulator
VSRERINVSLTEEGLAILDRERQSMGLSRSAMFEVLLRFWIRDQPAVAQGRAAPGVGSEVKAGRTRRSRKS